MRSLTQRSLRRNIGIVQPDVFLFADSILENIRYGKPDATMDEIVEEMCIRDRGLPELRPVPLDG